MSVKKRARGTSTVVVSVDFGEMIDDLADLEVKVEEAEERLLIAQQTAEALRVQRLHLLAAVDYVERHGGGDKAVEALVGLLGRSDWKSPE